MKTSHKQPVLENDVPMGIGIMDSFPMALPDEIKRGGSGKNELARSALECAAFVLCSTRELPPGQQIRMLRLVRDFISTEEAKVDLNA